MQCTDNHNQSGVTVLEVGISVGVVILVLLGLVSAITTALDGAQYARNKAIASKYAQEAVEWLRRQRDMSWSTFYTTKAGNAPAGTRYCINMPLTDTTIWPSGSCGAATINDQYDLFSRELTLIRGGNTPPLNNDRVSVRVRVYWNQGSKPADVQFETYLSQWK